MAQNDWYRSPDWDHSAEREFRQRLARARPHNQIQYRRIKGGVLLGSGDPATVAAGRRLLMEVVDSEGAPDFERVCVLSMLGKEAFEDGRHDEADALLRRALNISGPNRSGRSGMEEVWIAKVALGRDDREGLREAAALLEQRSDDPPLILSVRYEIALTAARIALALGDRDSAATWARAALQLGDADYSGLANHPRLGLVAHDAETRAWLMAITEGS